MAQTKKRTMITVEANTLKEAQTKCALNGQKLSAVIELFLKQFLTQK